MFEAPAFLAPWPTPGFSVQATLLPSRTSKTVGPSPSKNSPLLPRRSVAQLPDEPVVTGPQCSLKHPIFPRFPADANREVLPRAAEIDIDFVSFLSKSSKVTWRDSAFRSNDLHRMAARWRLPAMLLRLLEPLPFRWRFACQLPLVGSSSSSSSRPSHSLSSSESSSLSFEPQLLIERVRPRTFKTLFPFGLRCFDVSAVDEAREASTAAGAAHSALLEA